jgi:hypothetical protein
MARIISSVKNTCSEGLNYMVDETQQNGKKKQNITRCSKNKGTTRAP